MAVQNFADNFLCYGRIVKGQYLPGRDVCVSSRSGPVNELLCGSQRISAPSAFKLQLNAENAEVRRGRREELLNLL